MATETVSSIINMVETLPDSAQNTQADYIRNYIADNQDEQQWQVQFKQSQTTLIAKAKLAKQQIAEGLAKPFNIDEL